MTQRFAELDVYPDAQRQAVLEELDIRCPHRLDTLVLPFAFVPFALMLGAGNALILRNNLNVLLAVPLVLVSALVSVVPIWCALRWYRRRTLRRLLESRTCACCGYSLLGMQATQVWVSCPECGEIYRPEPHELTAQGLIATPTRIGRLA